VHSQGSRRGRAEGVAIQKLRLLGEQRPQADTEDSPPDDLQGLLFLALIGLVEVVWIAVFVYLAVQFL
jgi:hypothetical protein